MTIEQLMELAHSVDIIYLDVDGVILDSASAIVELLNQKYETNCKSSDITSWDFKNVKSDLTSQEIESIFNDKRFFDIVRPYDGVFDFMRKFRFKIRMFSKGGIDNIYLKRKYFDSCGFEDIKLIGLPLSLSKGLINMRRDGLAMFIDDSTNNLEDCNADIRIQFKEFDNDAEWQRNWNGVTMKEWV